MFENIQGIPHELFSSFVEADTFSFERQLISQGYECVAGTDEVGRGPLAGPVVAACVVLPKNCDFKEFNDSKKLTAKKRERIYDRLRNSEALVGLSMVSEESIDKMNILQASLTAMRQALEKLSVQPDFLLVDGKHKVPVMLPQLPLVKGDSRSATISAASIIAKVTRDRLMSNYHDMYPHYNFKNNKGYGTAEHRAAIEKYGPCPIHRKSFRRVKEFVGK